MSNDSTFKKYEINENVLPDSPSQITTESVGATLGAFGASTLHWKKVGNLYFDIYFDNGGGGLNVFFTDDATTYNQVATLIGITVNTAYTLTNYGAYTAQYAGAGVYNGTVPGNTNRTILGAILST